MIYTVRGTLTHVSGSTVPVELAVIEPLERVITEVQIEFTGSVTPDKVGIRIVDGSQSAIPYRSGFIGSQNRLIVLADEYRLVGPPHRMTIQGFNSDTTNDVTYEIRITVVTVTLLQAVWGLVEMGRRWLERSVGALESEHS